MSVAGPITRSQTNKTKLIGILDSILSEFRPPPPPVVPESAEDAGDVETPTNIIEASVADADQVIRPFVDVATPTNIIEASVADADQVIQSFVDLATPTNIIGASVADADQVIQSFVDLATPTNIIEASVADADQVIQSFVGVVKSDAAGLTDSGDDELSSTGEIKPRSVTSTTRKDYGFSPIQPWDFEVIHEDVEDVLSSGVDRPRYVEVSFAENGDKTSNNPSTMCGGGGSGKETVSKHVSNKSKVTGGAKDGKKVDLGTVAAPKSDSSRRHPIVRHFNELLTEIISIFRRIPNISRRREAPIQQDGEDLSSVSRDSRDSSTGPLTEETASDKSSENEPDAAGNGDAVGDTVVDRVNDGDAVIPRDAADAAVPRDTVDDVGDAVVPRDDDDAVVPRDAVNAVVPRDAAVPRDAVDDVSDTADDDDIKSVASTRSVVSPRNVDLTFEAKSEMEKLSDLIKQLKDAAPQLKTAIESGQISSDELQELLNQFTNILKPPAVTTTPSTEAIPGSAATGTVGPAVTGSPNVAPSGTVASAALESPRSVSDPPRPSSPTTQIPPVTRGPTMLDRIRQAIGKYTSRLNLVTLSRSARETVPLLGVAPSGSSTTPTELSQIKSEKSAVFRKGIVDLISSIPKILDSARAELKTTLEGESTTNISELVRNADRVVSRFIPMTTTDKVDITELVRDADRVVSRFIPIVPPAKPINIAELVRDADRVIKHFTKPLRPTSPTSITELFNTAKNTLQPFIPTKSDTGKRKLSNQSTEYTSAEDAENNEMLSKLKENNLLVSTHTDYISYTGDTPDDTAPAVYKYAIVDVQPTPTTPDTIAKDTSASIEKSVVYVPTIEEIPPSSKAAEKSG